MTDKVGAVQQREKGMGMGKRGGAEERDAVVASAQINDNQIKFKYIFLFHYTLELKPRELCSIVENSST